MNRQARRLGLLAPLLLAGFPPLAAPAGGPEPSPSPAAVLGAARARPAEEVQLPEVPPGQGPDHSLSPYFVIEGGEDGEELLPLEETGAEVAVAGPIARVRISQVFRNRGRQPIEARYVFPASTRAAVHGMRLRVGARVVEARIERRAQASADYAQARADGRRAALLAEERPNVFTMRVANVMPGDRLVAELEYSELLLPERGVYELVYPAVVGPRFAGGADPARDAWIANPTLHQREPAPYGFAFAAHLESALPLRELSSPSHALAVAWRSPRAADVTLRDGGGGDRDVVLRWRLAGDAVEAGALVFQGPDGDGWFLATVEPPARVAPELVPPREYVFVLDVSGSMQGFPLATARALMGDFLPRLRPIDRFNFVCFSGGSFVLSPSGSLPATPANVRQALETFGRLRGGGGTELLQALRTAYALPRADRSVARTVVVVTDGYVAVEAAAFRLVRQRLDEASCFAFGIGTAVNRALIEALARAGQGEATVVTRPEEARAAAERLERIIATPVLSQLHQRVEGLDARDVLPTALPDLLAERPVVILGRFRGPPQGRLVVEGQGATGPFRKVLELGAAASQPASAPLRVLWARRWVEQLLDEHHLGPAPEMEEAVTALGLAHHLLTPFTAFVAVDSEVVNRGGRGAEVAQPLPLPQGVSDLAVGGALAQAAPRAASPEQKVQREATDATGEVSTPPKARAGAEVAVLRESAEGLREVPALRVAVLAALERLGRSGLRGEVELSVTVDAAGAIVRVEVARAPGADAAHRVRRALAGLVTAARPAGPGTGTYRAVLRVGPREGESAG